MLLTPGELLITLLLLAPLAVLAWILIRYAGRIRRDLVDKQDRSARLDEISPAIVRFTLERDEHTCRTCGSTSRVGVDFTGATPDPDVTIGAEQLEARCTTCFQQRWRTLSEDSKEQHQ
jgi:hypothetical protein